MARRRVARRVRRERVAGRTRTDGAVFGRVSFLAPSFRFQRPPRRASLLMASADRRRTNGACERRRRVGTATSTWNRAVCVLRFDVGASGNPFDSGAQSHFRLHGRQIPRVARRRSDPRRRGRRITKSIGISKGRDPVRPRPFQFQRLCSSRYFNSTRSSLGSTRRRRFGRYERAGSGRRYRLQERSISQFETSRR